MGLTWAATPTQQERRRPTELGERRKQTAGVKILARVDRAAVVAQRAAHAIPTLRVGIVDASYDSMPQILPGIRERYPDLEIHEVEAGVPEQFRLLVDGRLDVGLGRASLAPPEVASELVSARPARRPTVPSWRTNPIIPIRFARAACGMGRPGQGARLSTGVMVR